MVIMIKKTIRKNVVNYTYNYLKKKKTLPNNILSSLYIDRIDSLIFSLFVNKMLETIVLYV